MMNAADTIFNQPVHNGSTVGDLTMYSSDVAFDESRIQSILRDLEIKGADGLIGLENLAKQVSNHLGVVVTPHVSPDNQFSLTWTEADPSFFFL